MRWNGRRRMKWQIPLAAVLGIGGLLVNDASGICVAALFAAALHECGHLLAARWMRIPLRALRVDSLGARLEVTGRMLSYGEEWILCAAGPMASLLASAAVAPLWTRSSFATLFSCASLLLGFLNLLPVSTFDGGRMLECMLLRALSAAATHRIMQYVSFLFLFLLWAMAVYFLLRAGDGLSLFAFSMSLFFHFFKVCDGK